MTNYRNAPYLIQIWPLVHGSPAPSSRSPPQTPAKFAHYGSSVAHASALTHLRIYDEADMFPALMFPHVSCLAPRPAFLCEIACPVPKLGVLQASCQWVPTCSQGPPMPSCFC